MLPSYIEKKISESKKDNKNDHKLSKQNLVGIVCSGNLEAVKKYLTMPFCNLKNECDNNGETSLCWAVFKNNENIVRVLLNHRDGCFLLNHVCRYDNYTPLMQSIRCKNYGISNILLHYGANINKKNNLKNTALYYAVKLNDVTSIEILLQHGAVIEPKVFLLDNNNLLFKASTDMMKRNLLVRGYIRKFYKIKMLKNILDITSLYYFYIRNIKQ